MPKLIIHVIPGLQVGGAEMALLRLVSSSDENRYRHEIVSLTPWGGMLDRYHHAGIFCTVLDVKKFPIRSVISLYRMFRNRRPDIVQTWLYHGDLIGGLVAKFCGVHNVIWGVRTTQIVKANGARSLSFVRWLCSRLSHYVPRVIVCAANVSARAHIEMGYCKEKIRIIHNGLDLPNPAGLGVQANEIRQSLFLPNETFVVGSVGRFNKVKNQKLFIDAAKLVKQQLKSVHFLMVGRDLDHENEILCGWIREAGLMGNFHLVGERGDVSACLAAMNVYCMHSMYEGFPNVVAEALAVGCPVVAVNAGDVSTLLNDGRGWIVENHNAKVLADQIVSVLNMDRAELANISLVGKGAIQEEFSTQAFCAKFESIYDECVD